MYIPFAPKCHLYANKGSPATCPGTRTGTCFSAAATFFCAGVGASIGTCISAGISARTAAPAGTPDGTSVHAVDDGRLFGKCVLNVGVKPVVVG